MASSQCPTDRNFIVVDFHYNGTFAPNPLVYFDPDRQSVRDVDFSAFDYEEFMEFLQKLTRSKSKDIYFCLSQESLSQGIHTLVNDDDYKEFLDLAYANERRMNVYVDQYNEPIFEWIEEEENEDQDYSCEEDEDSVFPDTYYVDHEEDDAEYPFLANKTMGDRQAWNQIKPLLASSSRGSGVGPSQPPDAAASQPPQPPPSPPPAAAQPPPPPPTTTAARSVPRRAPIDRSVRRQYFERIVKMALRRNILGVGSSAENHAVID
ncbi:unnamed protein product [Lactuca virosa]|uniref:PB1-like domain-containing protein n=1 Tax=Lactuca virosa TaxID=75947 RepID=A0AAU9MHQ0_9ASTR|nr:unnamed protein product [Lactuca virosa]